MFWRCLAAVLLSLCATVQAAEYTAGFLQVEESEDAPEVGIWYPSVDDEVEGKLGPFRPVLAWDGAAAEGVFPVIVMSHGNGGKYRNHRETAALLARRGYIVVAPNHPLDRTMSARNMAEVMGKRAMELKTALDILAAHPQLGEHADMARTGALGYSLGTATALFAGGATPQMSLMREHCEAHREDDEAFCGGSKWAAYFVNAARSALAYLAEKGILNPETQERSRQEREQRREREEFAPLDEPVDFRAVALVAPIGAVFSAERLSALSGDIAIFRLNDDTELKSPYHAEHLRDSLGGKVSLYQEFPGVHHYAFISPFPQWLLEEEDIPVAIDPEGFDRRDFIRGINIDIADFFDSSL